MDALVETVLPLLRGLTFDGEKGSIVRFADTEAWCRYAAEKTNSGLIAKGALSREEIGLCGAFPLSIGEDVLNDPTAKLPELFRSFVAEYGVEPRIAVIAGKGVVALGSSFDSAGMILGGFGRRVQAIMKTQGETKFLPQEEQKREIRMCARKAAVGDTVAARDGVVRGKVSVVTGGAQGFGESIVRYLVDAGSFVFIADLNLEGARRLADELNRTKGSTVALPVRVDVSNEESVHALMSEIVLNAGGLDVFVSNAGVLKAGSVKDMDYKSFQFVTNVNYTGYFLCVKHAARVLALQNMPTKSYFSDIIQINSKSGLEGSNRNGAYAGSKFGGIGLTQSFALELVSDNIKVNSICPGNFFDGPLWSDPENGLFVQYLRANKVPGAKTVEDVRKFYESKVPMGRGCTAIDVVRAIFYLIEQKYETGQALPVTGGQVMLN